MAAFVRDVMRDPRADSMVQVIAQLARTMSLDTVAEYVETEEIRERIAATRRRLCARLCPRAGRAIRRSAQGVCPNSTVACGSSAPGPPQGPRALAARSG